MNIKVKNISIFSLFWVLLIILTYLLIVFLSDRIDDFRIDRFFSYYDSESFYNAFRDYFLFELDQLYGAWGSAFTDPAYPAYLLSYKWLLGILGVKQLSYQVALTSNVLLIIIMAFVFYHVLKPTKIEHLLLFIIAFIDCSLIAFSLTLEREFFAAIILVFNILLINKCIVENKWGWRIVPVVILFFVASGVRILLPTIIISSLVLYFSVKIFRRFRGSGKYLLLLVFIVIAYFYLTNKFPRIEEYLLANRQGSGIGALVGRLPLIPLVLVRSLLYMLNPIPITYVLDQEFLFPYEYFLGFSGVTYFMFWIFILKNYRYLYGKLEFLFITLLVGHIFAGGLLFNIRHRTDVVVVLIVIVLGIFQYKLKNKFTVKYLLNEVFLCMLISLGSILTLHLLYILIKLLM